MSNDVILFGSYTTNSIQQEFILVLYCAIINRIHLVPVTLIKSLFSSVVLWKLSFERITDNCTPLFDIQLVQPTSLSSFTAFATDRITDQMIFAAFARRTSAVGSTKVFGGSRQLTGIATRNISIGTDLTTSECTLQKARPWVRSSMLVLSGRNPFANICPLTLVQIWNDRMTTAMDRIILLCRIVPQST